MDNNRFFKGIVIGLLIVLPFWLLVAAAVFA